MRNYFGRRYDALVNVTNICDARCVMCNIWKNRESAHSWLKPEWMAKLGPLSTISFAGGEPFLHKDLVEIIRVVHEENPAAKIVFSTNGFRTDVIANQVSEILRFHKNLQVTISLDGVGETHDRIRGVPGAWQKVNATFDRLGEIGLRRRNFAFTITRENIAQLPAVFQHARTKGAGLSLAVAQSSRFLNVEIPRLSADALRPHLEPIIQWHLKSWNPADWPRAFFQYGLLKYLETGRRPLACDALANQFMVSQTGEVMSCHPLLIRAGRLAEQSLDHILQEPDCRQSARELTSCHACWEVCTARSAIRTHKWRVALWILANKFLAHAGAWDSRKPSRLFPLIRQQAVAAPTPSASAPSGEAK
jgi:MoaA/NifB/PqqE/SkfB family radical SAM enzyme